MKLVIMQRAKIQKFSFGGLVKDSEALLGFLNPQAPECFFFLPAEFFSEEDLFGGRVGEISDHLEDL